MKIGSDSREWGDHDGANNSFANGRRVNPLVVPHREGTRSCRRRRASLGIRQSLNARNTGAWAKDDGKGSEDGLRAVGTRSGL